MSGYKVTRRLVSRLVLKWYQQEVVRRVERVNPSTHYRALTPCWNISRSKGNFCASYSHTFSLFIVHVLCVNMPLVHSRAKLWTLLKIPAYLLVSSMARHQTPWARIATYLARTENTRD